MPACRGGPSEVLDGFAGHLEYEVKMFVEQVEAIVDRYGCETPPSFSGPAEDAVLEASLVHLRLLDDFLRNRGDDTDIKASDWVRGWQSGRWLDPRVRARINWQVAHLSALRVWSFDWNLCEYGSACCEELGRFFEEVEKRCPERLPAFGFARELAKTAQAKFGQLLASS
jgi:hypothetical protein